MNPTTLFINPNTNLLRSPLRMLIFLALSPQIILLASANRQQNSGFEPNFSAFISITIFTFWTVILSWFCLRFFDHENLESLGFAMKSGWLRHIRSG
ncbi:MAG: hypothetical protein J2P41_22500, partial [Blastocatellia bacterium]|nr:hypothetical protein [Blastocatellia bacterium]